jgi:hypothetical protein
MTMKSVGYTELPKHNGTGGFDHADINVPSDRLYVAYTSTDAGRYYRCRA